MGGIVFKLKNIFLNRLLANNNTSIIPAYFIKENYRHRIKPSYFNDMPEKSGITWQPDVYHFSSDIASRFNCSNIIDIGCGNAQKLVTMYPKFNVIGIDFGNNLAKCNQDYKFGTWIEYDFDKGNVINIQDNILKKSIIICSDIIEHLVEPSHLLDNLKNFMNYSDVCILTTPERDLTRGKNNFGPPDNPHHVREWNMKEMEKLLNHYKFNIGFVGLTASNDKDFKKKTMLFGLLNNTSLDNSEKWKGINRKHTTILKNF